jgi:hypothetical protein
VVIKVPTSLFVGTSIDPKTVEPSLNWTVDNATPVVRVDITTPNSVRIISSSKDDCEALPAAPIKLQVPGKVRILLTPYLESA